MRKYTIEVKWSILFMVIMLLWMWLEKLSGLHDEYISKHAAYTNFFAIPALAVFVIALLDKRKNFYSGKMSWKQGFFTGLIVTIGITILSPLGQLITHYIISPDYFKNAIEYSVSSEKMPQADAEAYFSFFTYLWQSTVGALTLGIVTSAIVAIFIKKK